LRGPEARDLNGDGRIDGQDYDLFVRQNGSFPGTGGQLPGGNIPGGIPGNIGDFPGGNIPTFPSPDEWLKSGQAEDLNRDGRIDGEDFEIYKEIAAEEGGICPRTNG
ncbi:MAG: hypothetical protein HYW07_17275, partial [Candidatus Latescibacteria bacterium]|nr:hypothetical protein [Candidatus Latescibacterota bacterium]